MLKSAPAALDLHTNPQQRLGRKNLPRAGVDVPVNGAEDVPGPCPLALELGGHPCTQRPVRLQRR